MTINDFNKAEPLIAEIEKLEKIKDSFDNHNNCLEYYHVEFSFSGNSVRVSNDDIGGIAISKLISNLREMIDMRIESLIKKLEEI